MQNSEKAEGPELSTMGFSTFDFIVVEGPELSGYNGFVKLHGP